MIFENVPFVHYKVSFQDFRVPKKVIKINVETCGKTRGNQEERNE